MPTTHPSSRPRLRALLPLLLLALTVLLTAPSCGTSDTPTTSPTATDSSVKTSVAPTSPLADKAIVEATTAAYVDFWNVWLKANNPADPTYPGLTSRYTGRQLEGARRSIQEHLDRGLVVQDEPDTEDNHELTYIDLGETQVSFADCMVDDGRLVDADTGEVVDGTTVTVLRTVSMIKEDGLWKVEAADIEQSWDGDTTCS